MDPPATRNNLSPGRHTAMSFCGRKMTGRVKTRPYIFNFVNSHRNRCIYKEKNYESQVSQDSYRW